jgi:DNA-binding transcriptional regulator YiaG
VNGCLCEFLGLPCECPGRRGRPQSRPHGTLAAARRHYRHDGPGWRCRPCRQAEQRDNQDRAGRPRTRTAPSAAGLAAGRAVREMRCAAGMTQRDLADALGASQAAVSAWERDEHGSGPDLLARVAAATGAREVPRAA